MSEEHCHKIKVKIDTFAKLNTRQQEGVFTHIADCVHCREYKTLADATTDRLSVLNSVFKPPSDGGNFDIATHKNAEQIFQQISQQIKRSRRLTWLALFIMLSSGLALIWLYSQTALTLVIGIILADWAFGGGLLAWSSSRQVSQLCLVSNPTTHSFLARWSKELYWKIKLITLITWIVILEILYFIFTLIDSGYTLESLFILVAVNAVLCSAVIYAYILELPALKKELKLVGETL